MAMSISERHGAKPYAFQFVTRLTHHDIPDGGGGFLKVQPREIRRSGRFFINGKVMQYRDIPETQENRTLRDNMRWSRHPVAVETKNSYRHVSYFEAEDCIVDRDGNIIVGGLNHELYQYRQWQLDQWKKELDREIAEMESPKQ